jgi:hypothetical protein
MEPAMSLSLPAYIVFQGQVETYSTDRKLSDMGWAETVRDVATLQFDNLHSVVEVGTGREVTADAIRAAIEYRALHGLDGGEHPFAQLVELVLGTRAARPFFQRAA